MGILDKIQDIEREIAKTQKNKATEYHLGLLKAKLAKYRVSIWKTFLLLLVKRLENIKKIFTFSISVRIVGAKQERREG